MPQAEEALLAGSSDFGQALLGPLTDSAGRRPRVAADPAQLVALGAGARGLLVVELGAEWLPAIERLHRVAPGLRVLAAVPRGQEAAAARLAALGVEAVAWDGHPGPLLQALGRRSGARPPPAAPPTLSRQAAAPVPSAAPAAPAEPEVPLAVTPAPYLPPPPAPAAPRWPSTAPSEEVAESALVRSLRGTLPAESPLAGLAAGAVAALTSLERRALTGEPLPFDAAPIYRAAVTRLRTGAVLASIPVPPAEVDAEAVQRLLGDLDEVLGQVNPLAAQVPEALHPELEAVRNALVRVAVDFSEAVHRVGVVGHGAAGPAASSAGERIRAASRVLSVHAGGEPEAAAPRRPVGWLVALALVALATGGYHAWRWAFAPTPPAPVTLPGAPAGTFGFQNGNLRVLSTVGGHAPDAAEFERFVAQEKAAGRTVRSHGPGTWIIEPAQGPEQERKP